MIHYKCQCGFEKDVSDDSAGKQVRCPKCKTIGTVPNAPSFAEISTNPDDYADDPAYRPADGMMTVERPERGDAVSTTTANDVLLLILFGLKLLAGFGVILTVIATLVNKKDEVLAGIIFVSGLTTSAWTYVGAEAVRLLVAIERNTRKNT